MNHDRDVETNLERRQELLHDEEAFRLHQEEKRLRSARRTNTLSGVLCGKNSYNT
jgi:hypothetical protein